MTDKPKKKSRGKSKYVFVTQGWSCVETSLRRGERKLKERLQFLTVPVNGYSFRMPVDANDTVHNFIDFVQPVSQYELLPGEIILKRKPARLVKTPICWTQDKLVSKLQTLFGADIDPATGEVHLNPLTY